MDFLARRGVLAVRRLHGATREKALAVVEVDRWEQFLTDPHSDVLRRIVVAFDERHLERGQHKEAAKDDQNPLVLEDETRADTDHAAAHDQRADDAPEEHAMLILRRHREEREDQRDDEDVVHRERLLDDVANEILLCCL